MRLTDRRLDMQDVLKVLRTGDIWVSARNPRYDRDENVWTCRINGRDTEGRPLGVVVGLLARDAISIITAYPGRRRSR
jgi:hypothetical protein